MTVPTEQCQRFDGTYTSLVTLAIDFKTRYSLLVCSLVAISLSMQLPAMTAPVSFQQAVTDYNAGKHSQALSEFESYKVAYPNNALVHYYIALCHQQLNHFGAARSEYQWAFEHGDPRLRSLAETGMRQLSGRSTQISAVPSTSSPNPTTKPGASTSPAAKVRKIYEFWAEW